MKVGQKTIVRWMSKLVPQGAGRSACDQQASVLRELGMEQLRHVGGGKGSTQAPTKGW